MDNDKMTFFFNPFIPNTSCMFSIVLLRFYFCEERETGVGRRPEMVTDLGLGLKYIISIIWNMIVRTLENIHYQYKINSYITIV